MKFDMSAPLMFTPRELQIGGVYLHQTKNNPRFIVVLAVCGPTAVCIGITHSGHIISCQHLNAETVMAKPLVGTCPELSDSNLFTIQWKNTMWIEDIR